MALILEEIFHFKGLWDCDSCCRIRVYERADQAILVVFSELTGDLEQLGENEGTSITNMAETLATAWRQRYPGRAILFIEHYPARGYRTKRKGVTVYQYAESFDRVRFTWNNQQQRYIGTPQWSHIGRAGAEGLIGEAWPEPAGVDESTFTKTTFRRESPRA